MVECTVGSSDGFIPADLAEQMIQSGRKLYGLIIKIIF